MTSWKKVSVSVREAKTDLALAGCANENQVRGKAMQAAATWF